MKHQQSVAASSRSGHVTWGDKASPEHAKIHGWHCQYMTHINYLKIVQWFIFRKPHFQKIFQLASENMENKKSFLDTWQPSLLTLELLGFSARTNSSLLSKNALVAKTHIIPPVDRWPKQYKLQGRTNKTTIFNCEMFAKIVKCSELSTIECHFQKVYSIPCQNNPKKHVFSNWIVCVCFCLFPNNICRNHIHTFLAQSNQSNEKKIKHMACRLPVIFDPFSHQGRERAREGESPRCPWLGFDTQVSTTRFARESSEWRLWVDGWGEWEINTPHVSVWSD